MLEEPKSEIGSRRSKTPKNPPIMAHEGQNDLMSKDDRDFRKDFYDKSKIVKVLYNESTTWL